MGKPALSQSERALRDGAGCQLSILFCTFQPLPSAGFGYFVIFPSYHDDLPY
jgi:hypothetical protein